MKALCLLKIGHPEWDEVLGPERLTGHSARPAHPSRQRRDTLLPCTRHEAVPLLDRG
jgi:hypothetical protein